MTKLQQLIRYFVSEYPHKSELSNARLTKMVYLADWLSCQQQGRPITDINWYFNNYGPFVNDVLVAAKSDPRLSIKDTQTIYGTNKTLVELLPEKRIGKLPDITKEEKQIAQSVIDNTHLMFWNEFIKYVYSTYPVKNTARYTTLNLIEQAELERNGLRSADA